MMDAFLTYIILLCEDQHRANTNRTDDVMEEAILASMAVAWSRCTKEQQNLIRLISSTINRAYKKKD
jgi:hypothetical protein